MNVHVKSAFVAGHCKCTLENGNLVFTQDPISESISCPEEFLKFFEVVDEMYGVVNVKKDRDTHEIITTITPCPWINLHLHTEFSLLDGANRIKDLSKLLTQDGYSPCSAITDHGNMFGTYQFSKSLVAEGVKPIIGCEIYTQGLNGQNENYHLVLLCKDQTGYRNLCKILSEAENNFYYHANASLDSIEKHHEGLVCLSACLKGELPQHLMAGDTARAEEFVELMQEIFGDDFYIEIQDHDIPDELRIRRELIRIANDFGIKMVATTDSHYLRKEDAAAHEVLLCISSKKSLSNPSHFKFNGTGYHVMTNDEAYERFKSLPQAIATQAEIAEKCNFVFQDTKVTMPEFEVPEGETQNSYFVRLCKEGFENRFNGKSIDFKEYTERLDYEISVIANMQFEGYFLIVSDFINWAKAQDIAVGPGRGSCVGSLVAYCLGITDLDPIEEGLLFERFLNPERVSMPDIDVDIEDTRRDEVLNYVRRKYGEDHVARIITFGTLAARQSLKDVAKALDISPYLVEQVIKTIPKKPKITLSKAMDESPDFKKFYDTNKEMHTVIDIAMRLEGLSRHKSQHACGVIISKYPITDVVPEVILTDKHGIPAATAAFNMVELENLGLLKVDFLGLRNMFIIKDARKRAHVEEKDIDLYDPKVYEYLADGNTNGIFQLESPGMKKLIKDIYYDTASNIKRTTTPEEIRNLGKKCFERMVAAISLYRPGPMDYIPDYVAGLKNPDKVIYDTPELEPILKGTFGVCVYQEQVQQICRSLAGYSLARADNVRRAMSKKKKDVMAKEREVFLHGNEKTRDEKEALVPGCIENGISEAIASNLWAKMDNFSSYAFNKSHGAGYSVISVRTGWLKYYYPRQFWTSTLNSVLGHADKLKKYISSTTDDNIKVLKPSINISVGDFEEDGDSIRMGMKAIKNVGKSCLEIIEERTAHGPYRNLAEFITRIAPNQGVIEALAYSGTLDEFGFSRKAIITNMPTIVKFKASIKKFDTWCDTPEIDAWYAEELKLDIEDCPEFSEREKLEKEYQFSGMYISGHPLDAYQPIINGFSHADIDSLVIERDEFADEEDEDVPAFEEERKVAVIGILKEVTSKTTRKGDTMMVARIEDKTGSIKVTVFPKQVEEARFAFIEDNIVVLNGTWKHDSYGSQIIEESVCLIDDLQLPSDGTLFVLVDEENAAKIAEDIVNTYSGTGPVLCIRANVASKNGRATLFFDNEKKTLVEGPYKALKSLPTNAHVRVNMGSFTAIREMVKDISLTSN